jgi:hypothetical protein
MDMDTSRQTRETRISMTLGGVQMDPLWRTALWQQFGATIDMLENALLACPSTPLMEPLIGSPEREPMRAVSKR